MTTDRARLARLTVLLRQADAVLTELDGSERHGHDGGAMQMQCNGYRWARASLRDVAGRVVALAGTHPDIDADAFAAIAGSRHEVPELPLAFAHRGTGLGVDTDHAVR